MTPKALVALFRELAFDNATPPLWTDAVLLAHLNEAENEAARRARLYEDADTAEVCKIAVTAGKATYAIDPRVIFIRRVKLDSQSQPLPKISVPDLDATYPGWQDVTSGSPRAWAPWGNHKLRLVDPPDVDDTLRLIVVREPLQAMTLGDADGPELPERTQTRLVDWMAYRAYLARDLIEKYRPDEARDRLALFEAEFGPGSPVALETWTARKHGYDEYEGLY